MAATLPPPPHPPGPAPVRLTSGARRSRGIFRRRHLWAWHGWLGLNLGALLYVICISGTLAVFTPELDRWLDPVRRVTPPAGAATPDALARDPAAWAAWAELARAAHPGAAVTYLSAPSHPRAPAAALVRYDEHDTRRVFIDPHRHAVLGDRPFLDAQSFVRVFHKQFNISTSSGGFHGTWIVGAFAIVLLGAAVTGLLAFPRWWRALFTVRLGSGARAAWSDVHRSLGAWALLFTVVIALTGGWYWAERIALDASLPLPGAAEIAAPRADHRAATSAAQLPLATQLAHAFAAYPALRPTSVSLATRPGRPLVVHGHAEALAVAPTANHVAVDPATGAIVSVARATDLGALDRAVVSMDPLHFGTFGGLVTRVLWLVGGLALSLGILAGAILYALRVARLAGPAPRRSRAWWVSTVGTLATIGFATLCTIQFISGGQLPASGLPPDRPVPGGVPANVWAFVVGAVLVYLAPVLAWIRWIKW